MFYAWQHARVATDIWKENGITFYANMNFHFRNCQQPPDFEEAQFLRRPGIELGNVDHYTTDIYLQQVNIYLYIYSIKNICDHGSNILVM